MMKNKEPECLVSTVEHNGLGLISFLDYQEPRRLEVEILSKQIKIVADNFAIVPAGLTCDMGIYHPLDTPIISHVRAKLYDVFFRSNLAKKIDEKVIDEPYTPWPEIIEFTASQLIERVSNAPIIEPEPVTMADLLAMPPVAPNWIINQLVKADSLTILTARMKFKKTFMALQQSISVSTGSPFLNYATQKSKVLYYALEDGQTRIKTRLENMHAPALTSVIFKFSLPKLDTPQGLAYLATQIRNHQPQLVYIDTLAAVKTGKTDENAAGGMADIANSLRQVAQNEHCAVVLIAHMGKGIKSGNPGDDIRGSSAVGGAADQIIGIYKENDAFFLRSEGRDCEPCDLKIAFDSATTSWQLVGE
jgi:hypothetical protein